MPVEMLAENPERCAIAHPLLQDLLLAHQAIHQPFEREAVEVSGQSFTGLRGRCAAARLPAASRLTHITCQIVLNLCRADASTCHLTDEGGKCLAEAKPGRIYLQHGGFADRLFGVAWHVEEQRLWDRGHCHRVRAPASWRDSYHEKAPHAQRTHRDYAARPAHQCMWCNGRLCRARRTMPRWRSARVTSSSRAAVMGPEWLMAHAPCRACLARLMTVNRLHHGFRRFPVKALQNPHMGQTEKQSSDRSRHWQAQESAKLPFNLCVRS